MPPEHRSSRAGLNRGPVTLYAQLASILRDRIIAGHWVNGSEIPTLEKLTAEYGIARVTAQQAVQMLALEGIVSSQRGRRTYVTYKNEGTHGSTAPLYSSTGAVDDQSFRHSVRIISTKRVKALPARQLAMGKVEGPYVLITKVDSGNGVPYGLSDHYVALDVYKRFPRSAESRIRISRLVMEFSPRRPDAGHERIRVSSLTYDECLELGAPISMPAARVARVLLASGSVVHYADFIYRGDRFDMTREISEFLT